MLQPGYAFSNNNKNMYIFIIYDLYIYNYESEQNSSNTSKFIMHTIVKHTHKWLYHFTQWLSIQ